MKNSTNETEIVSLQHRKAEGMAAGLHYKDIYQIAKDKVSAFAKTLTSQSQIVA